MTGCDLSNGGAHVSNGAASHSFEARSEAESVPDFQHPMSIEDFRRRGKEMVDMMCDYYETVHEHPVRSQVEPGYLRPLLPGAAPQEGESFDDILTDVQSKILPGITHWQSPSFFAYFSANSSPPGLLGEMLASAFNTIGFSWITSPASTELETIVLDWMAKLLALPDAFLAVGVDGTRGRGGGVIQGTASEATLVALLAACARALAGRPAEDALRLVAYSSDQAHSCMQKACMVSGTRHIRQLPARADRDWALDPEDLAAAVEADVAAGLIPFYLVATFGTSSCAVDPLRPLGELAARHGMWMHVDAAYAGVAAILPEQRAGLDGLELAHSFCTNCHKWLLVNFDCSCMWVRDAEPLKEALSLTPHFLRAKGNALDYKDWQVPLGRRFRALKLWFVLRTYGRAGLQAYLRHHLALAATVEARVRADPRFELAAPPRLALVCFRLKGASREDNAALLESVNQTGRAFLSHTELGGVYTLRFAVSGAQTQACHVDAAWDLVADEASALLAARGA